MRKATVALGTVGIGAGLLYAFGRAREKNTERSLAMDEGVEKVGERGVKNQMPNLATSGTGSDPISEPTLSSMSPVKGGSSEAAERNFENDNSGTDQNDAVQILTKIKDEAFDSSDEKLALALGRPTDEIQAWTKGEQLIDSDALMKARALALERGLTINEQE